MSKRTTQINKPKRLTSASIFRSKLNEPVLRGSTPWLYRLVYQTRLAFMLVLFLVSSFLIQGVHQAYADTVSPEESKASLLSVEDFITELVPATATPEVEAPTVTNDDIFVEELVELELYDDQAIDPVEISPEDLPISTTPASADEAEPAEVDQGSEIEIEPETAASSTSTTTDDSAGQDQSGDLVDETIDITNQLTESRLGEPFVVTDSDADFRFNRDQCTALASGAFYCYEVQVDRLADALFAAPDEDGDLEIFLIRNGEQFQITSNVVDDASPYFDEVSGTIVWHREVDDRFQIMSYNVGTGEEAQLTHNNYNDMEPSRLGEVTVWQRWSHNGWNIILHDGRAEVELTTTSDHDLAPHLHGSLVVWNRSRLNGDRTIELYDRDTKAYVSIVDPEGFAVANPRMVVVYDSLHPNGDIVTRGYDIIARKFISLDTLPRPLPEELPSSESIGEVRALIQPKPTVKVSEQLAATNYDSEPEPESETDLLIATVIPDLDLRLEPVATTSVVEAIPDLIIPPYETLIVESKIEPAAE